MSWVYMAFCSLFIGIFPIVHCRFSSTPWLCSPHLQTAFLQFFGRAPACSYRRWQIQLTDLFSFTSFFFCCSYYDTISFGRHLAHCTYCRQGSYLWDCKKIIFTYLSFHRWIATFWSLMHSCLQTDISIVWWWDNSFGLAKEHRW